MKTVKALILCATLAVPGITLAQPQTSDVDYCNALAVKYREAIGRSNQSYAGVPQAIALCPTRPADAIPTLEKALRENKVDLPPRT